MCVTVHQQATMLVGGVMSQQPTDCQLCLRAREKKIYLLKRYYWGEMQMAVACENHHQNLTKTETLSERQAERQINRREPH